MYDVIKVSSIIGAILGICAIAEWIADNAPWVIWILIPVVVYVVFIATFGNQFRKEDKE